MDPLFLKPEPSKVGKIAKPTPEEKVEQGFVAAQETMGVAKSKCRAHPQDKSNKRYAKAIGYMGWGLGELARARQQSLNSYLSDLVDLPPNYREIRYLKQYLPLNAAYHNPKTGETEKYINMISDNLPSEVQQLPLEDRVQFVLMAMAVIHEETKFSPNLVSQKGARGLMQIMPRTALEIRKKYPEEFTFPAYKIKAELANPKTNIKIGLHLLYYLLTNNGEREAGSVDIKAKSNYAFIAYPMGEGGAKGLRTTLYQRSAEIKHKLYYKLYAHEVRLLLAKDYLVLLGPEYRPPIISLPVND